MNDKQNNEKMHIPYASRLELAICIALGCFNITLYALLETFTRLSSPFLAVGVVAAYLLEIALVGVYHGQKMRNLPSVDIQNFFAESSSVVFRNTTSPVFVVDNYGTVVWYNDAMMELTEAGSNFVGLNISALFGEDLTPESFGNKPVVFFGKMYTMETFSISESDGGMYLSVLHDITELSELKKHYEDERVAVAYISIDNVEDVMQYVHENVREVVSEVDEKIKKWASEMNGIVKAYDDDKYVMLFDSQYLDECIANRFSILDEIRDARVGDGVSITVSIGVSRSKGTLAERDRFAKEAIDLALQRGGDQAVYTTEEGIEYYGGSTKSLYKRYNVRSRTFVNQLTALMVRADNVIVMGHKYGDFDSFGASVGVARIAMQCGTKINIALDLRDRNLSPCVELLQNEDGYTKMFVDSAEAFDLISPDTLVVLVDHNNFERTQFSDIAKRVGNIVMIDHHRKIDIMPDSVKLHYIEPSASSTCEIVAEMIECVSSSNKLLKPEADLLLAGILLDTKQFTRNTGTRTFSVSEFLRGAGANPTDVYNLFKTEAEDLAKEARFHTDITVYKENIAISCCDGDTDESYRIIASKAADKMLTLKNIEASFTLVRIGEQIHISGRSNGKINVQLILEKCGGGGHFDVAGAQLVSETVTSVLEKLKDGIDDYLENNTL